MSRSRLWMLLKIYLITLIRRFMFSGKSFFLILPLGHQLHQRKGLEMVLWLVWYLREGPMTTPRLFGKTLFCSLLSMTRWRWLRRPTNTSLSRKLYFVLKALMVSPVVLVHEGSREKLFYFLFISLALDSLRDQQDHFPRDERLVQLPSHRSLQSGLI